jgi:hypothetical protein
MTPEETLAMTPPQVLMDLMQQLAADGLERAQAGEVPDLATIERGVAALCGKIAKLPAEEAKPFAPGLAALTDRLNTLEALLKRQHAEVAHEIRQTDLQRKAHTAYRTTQHFGGPVGEKE